MAKGPRAPQVNPGSVCCLLVRDRHEFVGDPRIAQNINSSETKISVALERGGVRRPRGSNQSTRGQGRKLVLNC